MLRFHFWRFGDYGVILTLLLLLRVIAMQPCPALYWDPWTNPKSCQKLICTHICTCIYIYIYIYILFLFLYLFYIHNVSADMSSGLLQVFVELRNLHGTSNYVLYWIQQDTWRNGYRHWFPKLLRRQSSGGWWFNPDYRQVTIQEYLTLVPSYG